MRPTSYQSEDLDRLLMKHKIATLDDLKAVLGTDVDSTVFRKLNELAYRTSYSHRGSYYKDGDAILQPVTSRYWQTPGAAMAIGVGVGSTGFKRGFAIATTSLSP